MDGFIAWCGFVGAWLLFAGPIYQAALELQEQDVARDRIAARSATVAKPEPVSRWWWLLPPVRYLLTRRRSHAYRQAVLAALDSQDVENLVRYVNKAIGWVLVGAGGLLLAVKETWELTEHFEWPTTVFWLLVVAMVVISAAYTAASRERGRALLSPRGE